MWAALRQHLLMTAVLTILGGALGYTASLLMTPVYTSSATIFVTVGGARSANDVSQTGTYLTSRMKSYVTLATSSAVLEEALEDIQDTRTFERLLSAADRRTQGDELNDAADQLQTVVTVANEVDTTVLTVAVDGPTEQDAQRLTNAVSTALANRIEETEQGANSFAPIRATVINGADLPIGPSSPKPYLNTVLGAAFGFALGAAISLLLYSRPARPARPARQAMIDGSQRMPGRRPRRDPAAPPAPRTSRPPGRSPAPGDVGGRR
ncbi:hypothetical protein ASG49_10085 [Marmoricola sp. Leaf446]|uniref:YveK family protein n=1 Tax=Marmoricola sp. Leaf446 TaxID=1736379 RepID=UPI0006FE2DB0|nr:Wzz/FepE/Etk N-terminal domain-containing protein [Marmoricola sp. Leaf446]KQT92272.1 hypothetical protein ASG49_10085 [Marmoricola sp. Leaf446]